jgi:hypothetical protein
VRSQSSAAESELSVFSTIGGLAMSAQKELDHLGEHEASTVSVVHQALRREVNEEINHVNGRLHVAEDETMDAMCECVHGGCTGMVSVPMAAYEQVRRFPTRFFVKAGHEVMEDERVVSEGDDYVVVEKFGDGGSYAVTSDPRSRRSRRGP